MFKNIFNAVFLLAFALSTVLQYNDPDPLVWMAIYSAATCMCLTQYFKNPPTWLPLVLLFTSLCWIGFLVPQIAGQVSWAEIFESLSMKTREVEEAREIGGLAFVALWALILLILSRRNQPTPQA